MNTTIVKVTHDSILWASSMVIGSSELGTSGSIALWIGVLQHAFATAGFSIAALKATPQTLHFYNINILICGISTYCYLLMALGQGYYVTYDGYLTLWPRYFEFTFGTPLLLIDLGLVAGAEFAQLGFIIICDIFMMWSGWSAVIATTKTIKWVFFAIGCFFYAPILSTLLGSLRQGVQKKSIKVKKLYNFLSLYTVIVWNSYPILWVLHDGFHLIDLNTECIIHTCIDFFAKDLFGYILISNHDVFEHEEIDDHKKTKPILLENINYNDEKNTPKLTINIPEVNQTFNNTESPSLGRIKPSIDYEYNKSKSNLKNQYIESGLSPDNEDNQFKLNNEDNRRKPSISRKPHVTFSDQKGVNIGYRIPPLPESTQNTVVEPALVSRSILPNFW